MSDREPVADTGLSSPGAAPDQGAEAPQAPASSGTGPQALKDAAQARRRGGSRWRRWATALLVVAVLVGGALAGLAKAESVVRARLEQEVLRALPGLSADAVVDPGEDYLLPQVWHGQVEALSLWASSLRLPLAGRQGQEGLPEEVTLQALSVHAQGLDVRSPHNVASLRVEGTLSWDEVTVLAGAYLESRRDSLPGGVVPQIQVGPGEMDRTRATTSVLGTELSAEVETTVSGTGDLVLTLSQVSAGEGPLAGSLSAEDGADLLELAGVPTTVTAIRGQDLPAGLRLVGVAPSEAGMVLDLAGQDLDLGALR